MKEKREKTENRPLFKRDERGLFLEGTAAGPGRTVGLRDFNTDFDEAVEELAKEDGITLSEARKILLKVAYKAAKAGSYPFYKDTIDRRYGAVKQKTDFGGEITLKTIIINKNGESNNQSSPETN